MPKILLLNGSPNREGCTYTALKEVADTLNKHGVETEIIHVGNKPIQDCIACMHCQKAGDRKCVFSNDAVNEVIAKLAEADGLVAGSPVYYSGPTGRICSFLDRVFFAGGEIMPGKIGAAVVSCRRGGATAAFNRLNLYFSMNNMIIATSQYWNQVHGFTPDDVRKDIEGMQTMRTLGQNIAWLLRGMKDNPLPEYEPATFTNFIH